MKSMLGFLLGSFLWLTATSATAQTVIATVPIGAQPVGIAVNQRTNFVYVSNYLGNSISVIDGETNAVAATVAVGKGPQAILAYAPANLIFVDNVLDKTITTIDGGTNTVLKTVPSPGITAWAELGASKYVYASDFKAGLVRVLDITKLKVVASIPVAEAWYIAVNPKNKLAYVATNGILISVIDTNTNAVIGTFSAGRGTGVSGLSADPVNNLLYAGTTPPDSSAMYISVFDATLGTLLGTTIPVGGVAAVQSLSPVPAAVVTGGIIQGQNQFTNSALFINGSTDHIKDTVQVGNQPTVVAYNSSTRMIYIANWIDNSVSVIAY